MSISQLWIVFWVLAACTSAVAFWIGSTYARLATQWWRTAQRQRRRGSVVAAPIAAEFLRSQARIGRLKRRDATDDSGGPEDMPANERRTTQFRRLTRAADAGAGWFGRLNLLLGCIVVTVAVGGVIWEQRLHPPLPPGATQLLETSIMDLALQTSYRIAEPLDTVRAFYRRELPQRGWHYCGTQATPGCSNMPTMLPNTAIDVYRRDADPAASSKTIEVWAQPAPDAQTFVTVLETRPQ